MNRLVLSFALAGICVTGCKKKQDKPADPAPPIAPAVAIDAAAPEAPVDAEEQYKMKKAGVSDLVKLAPLPAGWTRDDDVLTFVVTDPSLEGGKLEIRVDLEPMSTSTGHKTPAEWSAGEVDHMKAKLTKTETVGKASIFDFQADRSWFWAYVPLEKLLWRCGGDLHADQKLPAIKDAVAAAKKICASMSL